jgi:succinyl-CoA synthetase beta subunit
MKLYEYQAKDLLEEYGVPTLRGETADSPEDAARAAERLGGRVAVKAQVLAGGRGKAGGVKIARDAAEARERASDILSMRIKSVPVRRVLVVEAVDILKEYYLALTVDRGRKRVVLIGSAEGGVDIEELAAKSPRKIRIHPFEPAKGPEDGASDALLGELFGSAAAQAGVVVRSLYRLLTEKDLSLVEINPLALLHPRRLAALDAKIVADDNGLFKHPEIAALRNDEEYSPEEIEAKARGLTFVSMEGTIGCMVNGAGLAMATMDLIKLFGGEPANFLDVGGSSSPQKVVSAFELILRNPRVKAILINIFGGITRCDDIARGFVTAKKSIEIDVPIVIRLIGTNEKEGADILRAERITVHQDLVSAVKEAVKLSSL